MQVNGVSDLEEHRFRKRFDRRKTVAPSVSWSGIHERPDQEPERADEIGPIRIVDNGSETVERVKAQPSTSIIWKQDPWSEAVCEVFTFRCDLGIQNRMRGPPTR
jgi:hypothetical protein